MFTERLP